MRLNPSGAPGSGPVCASELRRRGRPAARGLRGRAAARRGPDADERDEGARGGARRARGPERARRAADGLAVARRGARAGGDGDPDGGDALRRRRRRAPDRRGCGEPDRRRAGPQPRDDRREHLLERPDEPLPARHGRARSGDDDSRRRGRADRLRGRLLPRRLHDGRRAGRAARQGRDSRTRRRARRLRSGDDRCQRHVHRECRGDGRRRPCEGRARVCRVRSDARRVRHGRRIGSRSRARREPRPALGRARFGRLPEAPRRDRRRTRGRGGSLVTEPVAGARISVMVNGERHERAVEARRLLVHFLRDDLDLTGTHVGCDTGNCGACTVIVDGVAVKSCMMLAVQVDGTAVETVEGLSPDGELHPLQQSFSSFHALQCGYCTPGFIGQNVPRKEDRRLVQGEGVFVDDVKRHGMAYVHFVRSPYAHAAISAIDVSKAMELEGVYGTLIGEEVAAETEAFFQIAPPPGGDLQDYALAVGRVRHVGEPVVAVAAATRELARDAADLVEVEYEPLDPVLDPETAADPATAQLHEEVPNNTIWQGNFDYGDYDASVAEDIGGGFGNKICTHVQLVAMCLLARKLRRAVTWTEWRTDQHTANSHGNERVF